MAAQETWYWANQREVSIMPGLTRYLERFEKSARNWKETLMNESNVAGVQQPLDKGQTIALWSLQILAGFSQTINSYPAIGGGK
jgi:hypothetical protein